ncbi:MAG: tetratricopeptide repeat protein [Acidobacteriota bacterium]|nr:MAG: tetratricopeptide repeat protein [Acidobacteriota bacterium]
MKHSDLTLSGIGKYLAAAIFLAFVLFVGVSGFRQALSNHYSNLAVRDSSVELARSAIRWQPGNPNAYEALGTVLGRKGEKKGAVASFEEAVKLRENDFRLWLRLGSARADSGDLAGARTAFRTAISLAPGYSRPRVELGTFLLENSETQEAFRLFNEAAEREPALYPAILEIATREYPGDAEKIEALITPKSFEGKRLSAIYLIGKGLVSASVRRFLLSKDLPPEERARFVGLLIENKNFELAREVWRASPEFPKELSKFLIFDGGFERTTRSDESGFGWMFDDDIESARVLLEGKDVHSGSKALKFVFEGHSNPGEWLLLQRIVVKPGTSYQLKAFVRPKDLVTAGLPFIGVYNGIDNQQLARTQRVEASAEGWVELEARFNSGDNRAISVALARESCDQSPCPVFGELILDDFSLEEIDADR